MNAFKLVLLVSSVNPAVVRQTLKIRNMNSNIVIRSDGCGTLGRQMFGAIYV